MTKIKALILILTSAAAICSCRHNQAGIKQISDGSLLLQVKEMDADGNDPKTKDYDVRLVPARLLADKSKTASEALWYNMDSCFYVMSGKRKIYSSITQPIANGVTGSFEYMLSFNIVDLASGNWNLFYRDRYLNHKTYILSLPEK